MPRLQTEPTNAPRTYWKDLKALVSWNSPEAGHRWPLFKSILLRSVRIKLTKDEATVLPLRVRPAFIVLNFLDLTILAFLGFHPRGQDWVKLNDKILHFLCFFIVSVPVANAPVTTSDASIQFHFRPLVFSTAYST